MRRLGQEPDPVDRIFCASRDGGGMDDATFWTHVFMTDGMGWEAWYDEQEEEIAREYSAPRRVWEQDIAAGGMGYCPLCGAAGACSWDDNGLPLIHAIPVEMDS